MMDMMTSKQQLAEPLMEVKKASIGACEKSGQAVCRTTALIDGFYLCKNRVAACEHAFSYGLSYLCRSPVRHEYSKVK